MVLKLPGEKLWFELLFNFGTEYSDSPGDFTLACAAPAVEFETVEALCRYYMERPDGLARPLRVGDVVHMVDISGLPRSIRAATWVVARMQESVPFAVTKTLGLGSVMPDLVLHRLRTPFRRSFRIFRS